MTADDRDPGKPPPGSFSSPPCIMHEVDAATGQVVPTDPEQARDVARWRKAERERLIAARLALPAAERAEHSRRIARDLDTLVTPDASGIVSAYWPFRGEPDLRPWMADLAARGVRVALPVVIAKAQPLVFRTWTPGARLERGVWGIPFPADGAVVLPTIMVAPLVGFDAEGFRLGYGGGFFDRTLAAMTPRPIAIGVGHPLAALPTIYPQWHDVAMSWIVTGDGAPRPASPTT